MNGVLGILKEDLIDLAEESQQNIRGLRYTPAAALGTCRFKLKRAEDYNRILEVFEAHNIRYFFYAGGNDSQDTANKISKLAQERGYAMRAIGIPKTIDNDLVVTDHCPGYGNVIKFICTTIKEMCLDHEAMGQHDLVSIIEVMGRNAGWIAAGASLAKGLRENPDKPPHLVTSPRFPLIPKSTLTTSNASSAATNTVWSWLGKGSSMPTATMSIPPAQPLTPLATPNSAAAGTSFSASSKITSGSKPVRPNLGLPSGLPPIAPPKPITTKALHGRPRRHQSGNCRGN